MSLQALCIAKLLPQTKAGRQTGNTTCGKKMHGHGCIGGHAQKLMRMYWINNEKYDTRIIFLFRCLRPAAAEDVSTDESICWWEKQPAAASRGSPQCNQSDEEAWSAAANKNVSQPPTPPRPRPRLSAVAWPATENKTYTNHKCGEQYRYNNKIIIMVITI